MFGVARLVIILFIVVPLQAARDSPMRNAERGMGNAQSRVTADWVARQVDNRDTGRDARLELRMRLFDRHGRVRERALLMLVLRGRPHAGQASAAPGGDRVLVRFTYPNDIKGTSFLVWERPSGEDERFLYLPALGRVRRIAGAESQESFVGTDFTYEDIGGRELEDYTYHLPNENASWIGQDGRAHDVYQLESRATDRDAVYPRVISLVRKDTFVVVRAEIYNRRSERQKTYEVRRLERIEGVWTAMDAVMGDELQKTRTELTVTSADYNVGLTERDLSRQALEQPLKADRRE